MYSFLSMEAIDTRSYARIGTFARDRESPPGVALLHGGTIQTTNERWDALQGSGGETLRWLSGPHRALRYPSLAALAAAETEALLEAGVPERRCRFEFLPRCQAIELTLSPLPRGGAVVLARDELGPAELRKLDRAREALLSEDRMQALGLVAAGVAHELNHALNVLALRLASLKADPALAPATPRIEELELVIDEAAAAVSRLQDLARRRKDAPAGSLQLSMVIGSAVQRARELEEARGQSGRPVFIEADLPSLPAVKGDAAELSHIFLDLLLNARDAMPGGGGVEVQAWKEGQRVVVQVDDEGRGISPEHLARVFDPFFSMSADRDTGLGLSIASGVMERLGGTIRACNRPGGGARFTLTFPIAGESAAPLEPRITGARTRPLSVLLVDDERDNLEVLRDLLALEGHRADIAQSGGAALALLGAGNRYDLILCDVGMPGMSGWQVAREARTLAPEARFYMLTGWANEIAADDPHLDLVGGVLAKPLDLDELRALLAEVASLTGATAH